MGRINELQQALTPRYAEVLDIFRRLPTDDERAGAQKALADKRYDDVLSCGGLPMARRARRAWVGGEFGKAAGLYAASGPLLALRCPLYAGSVMALPAALMCHHRTSRGLSKPRTDDGVRACTLTEQLGAVQAGLKGARSMLKSNDVTPADLDDARGVLAQARAELARFDAAMASASLRLRASGDVRDQRDGLERQAAQLEQTIERVDRVLAAEARNAPYRTTETDFAAG